MPHGFIRLPKFPKPLLPVKDKPIIDRLFDDIKVTLFESLCNDNFSKNSLPPICLICIMKEGKID